MVNTISVNDVRIRSAHEADHQQVGELARKVQVHELQHHDRMKSPEAIGGDYIAGFLQACSQTRGKNIVADHEGSVVGYAALLARVSDQSIEEVDCEYTLVQDLPGHA